MKRIFKILAAIVFLGLAPVILDFLYWYLYGYAGFLVFSYNFLTATDYTVPACFS